MNSNSLIKLILVIICFNLIKRVNSATSCASDLEKCTSSVNPLLKNVSYMFPSSKDEVVRMCSIWGQVVECVRRYTKKCLSQSSKRYFTNAVENSIGTVHSICVSDVVQTQYLAKATCLRDVSVKNCKFYFNQLVDIVASTKSKDEHICCAYFKFRACVDPPLIIQCGDMFRNLMDHSLTFLIKKCDNDFKYLNVNTCPLPNELSSPTQRKLDDQTNHFDTTGGFYPIQNPQLMNSYSVRKQQPTHQPENTNEDLIDSTSSDSTNPPVPINNREAKSADNDEFQLNQANRFNRQDDEFETDKHRDYSTESPEYMMSHFSPGELHNNSYDSILNHYFIHFILIVHLIFVNYLL